MADRYFQIQLQASNTLAAYQPLCIRGGADAELDGTILFPAVGERWITLPGDPKTLRSQCWQRTKARRLVFQSLPCASIAANRLYAGST